MNMSGRIAGVGALSLALGVLTAVTAPAALADPGGVTTIAGSAASGDLREMGLVPNGLVVDGDTLYVADERGTVRAVDRTSFDATVVAGVGAWSAGPRADKATETPFNATYVVDRWGANKLLLQEQCGIVAIDLTTSAMEQVLGTCDESQAGTGEDGTPAVEVPFPYVEDLLADGEDVLYSTNYSIRRIDGETGLLSTLSHYNEDPLPGLADGVTLDEATFNDIGDIAWAANGDLLVAETWGNRIRVVESGGDGIDGDDPVTTLAGDASQLEGTTGNGVDGPAGTALLHRPDNLAALPDGRILFLEEGEFLVRSIGTDTDRTIDTIGGGGDTAPLGADGAVATTLRLNPSSLTVAGDQAYVGSMNRHLLYELDLTADPVTAKVVGGDGSLGYFGDGGPATAAQLHGPEDVAVAPDGSILVADTDNDRIRRIAPDGTISTAVGTGKQCSGSDCMFSTDPGPERDIFQPNALAVADDGTVYWAHGDAPQVFAMASDGEVRLVAGNGDSGAVDGDALPDPQDPWAEGTATLGSYIGGLALSPDEQYLYVADTGNDRVRRVELTGADPQVTTFAGNGFAEFNGDGEVALDTQMSAHDIAFAPNGDLLVADGSNYRVRRIDAGTQVVSTIMGTGIDPGLLEDPSVLDLEEDGEVVAPLDANVFAFGIDVRADGAYAVTGGPKVWLVDESGARRVQGHQNRQGFNRDAGPGVGVWASNATSVAFAPDGSLLVADSDVNRIRRIDTRLPVAIATGPVRQVYGRTVNVPVTLPAGATGQVQATVGSKTVTAQLSGGKAVLTLPARALAPGRRSVTVSYAGVPGKYAAATKTVPVFVAKASPTLVIRSLKSPVPRGQMAVFSITARAAGVTPGGKVTVSVAGRATTVRLNAQGRAVARIAVGPRVPVGFKRVSAFYQGNTFVLSKRATPIRVRVVR